MTKRLKKKKLSCDKISPHLTHCAFITTCRYESKCIVIRMQYFLSAHLGSVTGAALKITTI